MTRWTAADIPDQHGRTVIVTGANSGLGAQATRVLATAGAKVIMACRDPDKAQAVADAIDGDIEVHRIDLADQARINTILGMAAGSYTGPETKPSVKLGGFRGVPPRGRPV